MIHGQQCELMKRAGNSRLQDQSLPFRNALPEKSLHGMEFRWRLYGNEPFLKYRFQCDDVGGFHPNLRRIELVEPGQFQF